MSTTEKQRIKNSFLTILINFILMLIIVGCQNDCEKTLITPYFGSIESNDTLVYEFSITNNEIPGIKYIEIVKVGEENGNIFSRYMFYDSLLNGLSGTIEQRTDNAIILKEMIVFEMLPNGKTISQIIPLEEDKLYMDKEINCNWNVEYSYSWTSPVNSNIINDCKGDRNIFRTQKPYLFNDQYYSSIEFQESTTIDQRSIDNTLLEQINYRSDIVYLEDIGIYKITITYGENEVQEMKLLKILNASEWDLINEQTIRKGELLN